MTLPKQINSKESAKFVEGKNGEVIVRTLNSGGSDVNPLAQYLEMTETSTTVETYKYYESSSKATLYNTIVVTYTTPSKGVLESVEWL